MRSFPSDFLLGVATAAYQIEGAVHEDGRKPSIWDVFCHTPGHIENGDNADTACNHYHLWEHDVRLMKELGIEAYRFSVAWPRVIPDGRSQVNQQGLDFYRRLTDALLEAGIRPMITLYHWDLPNALQEAGGWQNRSTADAFAEYAEVVLRTFSDVVDLFITLNEPWCATVLGHAFGTHAPGIQDLRAAVAASHHLLLAHGKAVGAFRANARSSAKIGLTNVLTHVAPASDSERDEAAAHRMDGFLNRWFLDPLFRARYPAELEAAGIGAWVQPGDLECIASPLDFLGVNYYQTSIVQDNPNDALLGAAVLPPSGNLTEMGWEVHPEGLQAVLQRVSKDYGPIPIYVTENGAAYPDVVTQGQVHDLNRIEFLSQHLQAVSEARKNGADVRGYFVWSLLDNFEWAKGYTPRFGLVYVDYATQQRIVKDSGIWYRNLIQQREL